MKVLQHGIFEMNFIQEIKFLKAYYWANLGKFAFTPEDRIEWTQRAQKDLELLGISVDTYCNPDPANVYYRSFPADLCMSHASNSAGSTTIELRNGSLRTKTSEDASKHVPNDVV